MADESDKQSALTEEEERLIAEFEAERNVKKESEETAEAESETAAALDNSAAADNEAPAAGHEPENGISEPQSPQRAVSEADWKLRELQLRIEIEEELRPMLEKEIKHKFEAELRKKIEAEKNARQEEILAKLQKIERIEQGNNAEMKLEMMKKLEETMRETLHAKIKEEIREEMRREVEEEREKKKAELLKKLETQKRVENNIMAQKQKVKEEQERTGNIAISHGDKMVLLRLYEETMKILTQLMEARMTKAKADSIMAKSVEAAIKKNPDVLKRMNVGIDGKPRTDGGIDTARLLSNMNAMAVPEEKKTAALFKALMDIFDERIIGAEVATDLETKDRMMTELLNRINKIFEKSEYNRKMGQLFTKYIVPSTSLLNRE